MELNDYLDKFVQFLKSSHKAGATVIAYKKDIAQLLEYVKKQSRSNVKDVTVDDLNNYLALLHTQNYTPKSISRKINSIKTFYRFLLQNSFIDNNVSSSIVHPKFDSKAPRILTRMEYRALRDAARDDIRISAVIEILLQTGMRIGELAALQVSSIDEHFTKIPQFEGH